MKLKTLAMTLALTASAVLANDALTAITDHAKDLQGDYARMAQTLKNKDFALQDLQRDLNAIGEQLEQLQTLASQFEESAASLTDAQRKHWEGTKEVITLLDIFHDRKSEMLNGDNPRKKRKELKNEAERNAYRSSVLYDRASQLVEAIN